MRRIKSVWLYLIFIIILVACAFGLSRCALEQENKIFESDTDAQGDSNSTMPNGTVTSQGTLLDEGEVEPINLEEIADGELSQDFSFPPITSSDYAILYPESYSKESYDKSDAYKEKLLKKVESYNSDITDLHKRLALEGYLWLSSWQYSKLNSTYAILDDNSIRIGEWVFVKEDNEKNTNGVSYYASKPLSNDDSNLLKSIYKWGELRYNDRMSMWEWIKPSYNCSQHTVGWLMKNGVATTCPLP